MKIYCYKGCDKVVDASFKTVQVEGEWAMVYVCACGTQYPKGDAKATSGDYHYDNRIPIEEAANHDIAAYFEKE